MAQRAVKSKGISSPLQTNGLPAIVQSQVPALPGSVLMDVQKMMKDFEDRFTKKIDQLKLQMREEFQKTLMDIKEQIKKDNVAFRNDSADVLTAMSENIDVVAVKIVEIQEEQKALLQTKTRMEERMADYERGLLVTQYKDLEYVLRLRGLKENKDEQLKDICTEAFSILLQMDPVDMQDYIGKIYRVNSWVARQKNLPRDVLVHFESKQIRYDVAQAAYFQGLKIQEQTVRVIKEIPIKILKMRKDYIFLTDELKNRRIPFRWEIPSGLAVNYMRKRYRLLSVQQAEEFYYNVLNGGDVGKELEKAPSTQLEEAKEDVPVVSAEEGSKVRAGEKQEDKGTTRAMAKKMGKV